MSASANALLEVTGLRKSFGGVDAVKNVSFSLSAGELLALIGPNGAGKSTCFNMVNGQLAVDAGEVRLHHSGQSVRLDGLSPDKVWRHGVGRTFQIAATFASMTVAENIQMALLSESGELKRWWPAARDLHRDKALALLDLVGMKSQADRAAGVLAYGDIKRIELAMALANQPKLLLMDEPTAGMAPKERNELMRLTKTLCVEQGIGVLFTEHSMDVVFAYADRVIVLARGELIAQGSPADVRRDPMVQQVYFGSGSTFEKKAAS